MKKYTKCGQIAAALFAVFVLNACDGSNSSIEQQNQSTALDKVVEYATEGKVAPIKQDYADIGLTGIDTEAEVAEMNEVVENSKATDVDSKEELESIAKDLSISAQGDSNKLVAVKQGSATDTANREKAKQKSGSCSSTCGSTCNKPAGSTCGSTCNKPAGSTCGSTCNKPANCGN